MSGTPGAASFSAVCASEFSMPCRATRAAKGTNAVRNRSAPGPASARSTNAAVAASYASFALTQLVCSLASLIALIM